MSIPREDSLKLLMEHVRNDRMIAHSIASEAVMRAAAERLGEDPDKWGTAGLLHDLDVEITAGDMRSHGLRSAEILRSMNYDPEIIDAIVMHNEEASGLPRSTKFHHALAACETITGLISATALVYPDKKLASVRAKSVTKRMKEKAFAASVKRENIMECEQAGIPLDEFAQLALDAMLRAGAE